jgi:hypothetical protein
MASGKLGNIVPSYHQGFARTAGESEFPDLWEGLAGAWFPTLGITGNNLFDAGSKKNHGVLSTFAGDKPIWEVSSRGRVLYFGGIAETSYVDIGDRDSLDIENDITIAAWVYPESFATRYKTIISKEYLSGLNKYIFQFSLVQNTGALFYFSRNLANGTNALTSTDVVALNTWAHVAFTIRNNVLTFYINGVPDSGGTQSASTSRDALPGGGCWIGKNLENPSASPQYYNGLISSVMVYNRALAFSEIQQNYLFPDALFQPKSMLKGLVPSAIGNPWYYYEQQRRASCGLM